MQAAAPAPASVDAGQQRVYFTPAKLQHLYQFGYVVIENLVDKETCDRCHKELIAAHSIWDASLVEADANAWKSSKLPVGTIHGILRLFGHFPFQYELRQQPRYAKAMAEYWTHYYSQFESKPRSVSEYDLVTSFDAAGFYKAEQFRANPNRMHWAHTDQGPHRGNEPMHGMCLQGLVNLVDSTGPSDGTLVVYSKSHRAHAGLFATIEGTEEYRKADETNWHRYSRDWIDAIELDARPYLDNSDPEKHSSEPVRMQRTRVFAPAGAGVFWFSKTLHENQAPYLTNLHIDRGVHDRAVQYVCMIPKEFLTPHDIEVRSKAWAEVRQSNHWAAGGLCHLFARKPRIYSDLEGTVARIERVYAAQLASRPLLDPPTAEELAADPKLAQRMVLSPLGKSLVDYHPDYRVARVNKRAAADHQKNVARKERASEAEPAPKAKRTRQTKLKLLSDRAEEDTSCCICFAAKPDSVFLDCGHANSCYECAKGLQACPVCRAVVVRVVKTYS